MKTKECLAYLIINNVSVFNQGYTVPQMELRHKIRYITNKIIEDFNNLNPNYITSVHTSIRVDVQWTE